MTQCRALYEFVGDTSQGELVFDADDVIDVIRQDIGEGWWEGSLNGVSGLLPASYVELIENEAAPPVPPPMMPTAPAPAAEEEPDDGEWDDDSEEEGGWDEASDEEEDPRGTPSMSSSGGGGAGAVTGGSTNAAAAGGGSGGIKRGGAKTQTMKRSGIGIRSSAYTKAGTEEYMIHGTTKKNIRIPEADIITVVDTKGQGPGWSELATKDVKVYHAGKKNPKKSFKSHTHFNITTAGTTVERRFKHFEWLHERLQTKYPCLCVPPIPDFKFLSKFGEESQSKKTERLQRWVNRVMRHPVLSRDGYSLKHFIETPYSDGKDWKSAKKKAEKDLAVGGAFFDMIRTDTKCPADSMRTIDNFGKFQHGMLGAVNKAFSTSMTHSNRMFSSIRKEYLTISESFKSLGDTIARGAVNDGNSIKLGIAFSDASATMKDIGELVARQPTNDEIPLMEGLKEYQAMLTQFDSAVKSSQTAHKKLTALGAQGELPPQEKEAYKERLDNIHTVTLCEIHHFHETLKSDFKEMLQHYLAAQIAFHEQVIVQLETAKASFDGLPF